MKDNFVNSAGDQGDSGENKTKITSSGVKITNAVYKLLDFFPDPDPLKNKAKEKALAILEGLTLISGEKDWVSFKNYFSEDKERAIIQLFNDINILENYLKIGKSQGWLDIINFLIIIKEYQELKIKIGHLRNNKNLEIFAHLKLEAENRALKQNSLSEKSSRVKESNIGQSLVQDISSSISFGKQTERRNPLSYKISARQEKILQILNNREKTQVADIIKEIPSVTKRTLRRDLDDLLKTNAIVRVGKWNQVFYKTLKSDDHNQNDMETGIIQNGKMILTAALHSIDDLAQLFDYSKGTFANYYNPELASKIRKINLPEQITSIDQLESIIKVNLTSEEQIIISRHLKERIDELKNGSYNYRLVDRTDNLSY